MRTIEWDVAVRALEHLGCSFYGDNPTVNVVRFPRVFVFRRMPLSVAIQRKMLDVLGFSEGEWLQALRDSSRS